VHCQANASDDSMSTPAAARPATIRDRLRFIGFPRFARVPRSAAGNPNRRPGRAVESSRSRNA
jgi:hypothetical protein